MSYSQTLDGPKNNTSSEKGATPLKTRYNEELMFYVYQQVVEAIEERIESNSKDLNSLNLIREAKNRARNSLTTDLLLEGRQ
jgi:hypothetical protein